MAPKRARPVVLSEDEDGSDFEIVSEAINVASAPGASSSTSRRAGSSKDKDSSASTKRHYQDGDAGNGSADEEEELGRLDEELASIREQVHQLLALEDELKDKRAALVQALKSKRLSTTASRQHGAQSSASARAAGSSSNRDYKRSDFPWSQNLRQRLQEVWGYNTFRFCQEAVCNAALDGRDAVVIMPTGSGKSICYQLPALLSEGLTVVVSPLISLMLDQVLNLREVGVKAELLSAAVPRAETAEILKGVREGTTKIKLLYVTPERVAKSKTLMSALQKAYERGKLSHIVIDEAHCAASMGHDYRPDYKGLSIFRKVFPDVPLQMLTATCGPKVLEQVIQIMGVKPTTSPSSAAPNRTLLFQAPLYRPNLIYSVLPRPAQSNAASQAVVDWIVKNHRGQSGIVYCLSKKDSETMAQALSSLSNRVIRTAVYHADLDDESKTGVHMRWRQNKVQVICATIAFGMGIDKPDVRFVIHACISKSIEGLYQESGRAGRDGKDADCVLFYRTQDATRISSLVAGEPTGAEKVRAVLEYVQSERCRKVIFGEYFADTSGGQEPCGRCDNCVHPPTVRDLTFEAWQVLKVTQDVQRGGGRLTLAQLADLARGLGGGRYTVAINDEDQGGARSKLKGAGGHVDLSAVASGKVELNKEECERLVVALLIQGFLQDDYHYTAYAVNVYVQPGPQAIRLTRLNAGQARSMSNMVKVALPTQGKPAAKPRASSSKNTTTTSAKVPTQNKVAGKKRALSADDGQDTFEDIHEDSDHEAQKARHTTFEDDDEELAALLDAEAEMHLGDDVSDDSTDLDENESIARSIRPSRPAVGHDRPAKQTAPPNGKTSNPTTTAAGITPPSFSSRPVQSNARPAATKPQEDGSRKRFRPYVPPSSSSGEADLLRPGGFGSDSTTSASGADRAQGTSSDNDDWEFDGLTPSTSRAGQRRGPK